jgi:hypothetical protein
MRKIYEITESGKNFMRKVGDYFTKTNKDFGNTSLLRGNNGILPFSDETDKTRVWTANIVWTIPNDNRNGTPITNNSELIEYLIELIETYAKKANVDANIMAAQCFAESEYRAWIYPRKPKNEDLESTAAGLSQIVMQTMYDAIYRFKWLNNDQINKITNGMTQPNLRSSWSRVERDKKINLANIDKQKANHTILHQNIIDNPDISILIQCKLMDYISGRNNNFASSSLFAYNRGSELESNNYIQLVNRTAANKGGNEYCNEGIKYVQEIFGYLGDPEQKFVKSPPQKDYTKGFSFNYTIDFNFDSFTSDSNSNYQAPRSTKDISALIPELREGYEYAKEKFLLAHPDLIVRLSSVYRTVEYQNELFQVGRDSRGRVIGETLTPLDGFNRKSFHNYYRAKAFDYNIFDENSNYLDGKRIAIYRPLYQEFAEYVRERVPNIKWGGGFVNQRNDVVHIQLA